MWVADGSEQAINMSCAANMTSVLLRRVVLCCVCVVCVLLLHTQT